MRMCKVLSFFSLTVVFLTLLNSPSFATADGPETHQDFQKELLRKLISATPGSVIELPEGTFNLDTQLSLMTDDITIRGQGMDKTVLSFKGQTMGAEGLVITSNGVKLEDFAIQDTKGDAIKINNSIGVTIRRIRTEWTAGPKTENGGYGIYPVLCEDVLIEDSVAIGASDAGLYVGQSKNIIIRRNHVSFNVAGIEIENSVGADVYENTVTNNSGGILVFNMPDIELKGERTRVFKNKVFGNNTANFSPAKNTVADVPAGTGIMITANKNVEIFENVVDNHQTSSIILASYLITGRPVEDKKYDPYPEAIFIYDNTLTNAGNSPTGGSSENSQVLVELLKQVVGVPFPHTIFDGSFDVNKFENGKLPDRLRICLQNNGSADFINLDALGEFRNMSRDLGPHTCAHEKLPAITIAGIKE